MAKTKTKEKKIKLVVDAIIVRYDLEKGWELALLKHKKKPFKGELGLPGGAILENKTAKESILTHIENQTNLRSKKVYALPVFDDPKRDERNRIITLPFMAFLDPKNPDIKLNPEFKSLKWWSVNNVPELMLDHNKIVSKGLKSLIRRMKTQPAWTYVLPKKFRFSDLQVLLERTFSKTFDKRNFKKKFLQYGILDQLDEYNGEGPGRPAALYAFNKSSYVDFKNKGGVYLII